MDRNPDTEYSRAQILFGYTKFNDRLHEYFAVYGGSKAAGADNNLFIYEISRLNLRYFTSNFKKITKKDIVMDVM